MKSLCCLFGFKTSKATIEINESPSRPKVDSQTDNYKVNEKKCALSGIDFDPFDSNSNKYDETVLDEEFLEAEDIQVSEVVDLFRVFQNTLCECKDVREKHSVVRKAKTLCVQIAHSKVTLTHEDFVRTFGKPSTAIQSLLEEIQEEPVALRVRHAVALCHFCAQLDQELEDESLSYGTGFLASLWPGNPLGFSDITHQTNPVITTSTDPPTLERCQDLDLVKIYRNLLKGGNYLPTAAEMNEILIRAASIFRELPNIVTVPLPVVVVGDIHGQMSDLLEHILPAGGPLVSEDKLRAVSACGRLASKKETRVCKGAANNSYGLKSEEPFKVGVSAVSVAALSQKSGKRPTSSSFQHQCGSTLTKSKVSRDVTNKKATKHTMPEGDSPERNPSCDTVGASTYLFLGDYVDRGKGSLQCLCLLFVAKILSPETIFLIRGNHECSLVNRHFGFLEECHRMYPVLNHRVCASVIISPATVNADGRPLKKARGGEGGLPEQLPSATGPHQRVDEPSGNESNACTSDGDSPPQEKPATDLIEKFEGEVAVGDAVEWDLGDHPLWIAANKAFECLPICAVIYETVERARSEAEQKEKEGPTAEPCNAQSFHSASSKESKSQIDIEPSNNIEKNVVKHSKLINWGRSDANKKQVVKVCAMHGGLSPYIENSLDGIVAINRFKVIENGALADLTWSDPAPDGESSSAFHSQEENEYTDCSTVDGAGHHFVVKNDFNFESKIDYNGPLVGFTHNTRGTGHTFGEDITCSFLKMNKLNYIIRAHQCVRNGFQWLHQHRVLTVFSASNYCGVGNKGSVVILDEHGNPELIQYGYKEVTNVEEVGIAAPVPPREFL